MSLRDVSLHVFKNRLKNCLEKESNAVAIQVASSVHGVISAPDKPVSFFLSQNCF